MTKDPYRIVIVAPISKAPSNEQMNWMVRRLRMLVKCAASLELGDIQVLMYPMNRAWSAGFPHWARVWTRPQGCELMVMDGPRWHYSGGVLNIREFLVHDAPDEIWCLNELGHGQMSMCAPARIWRAAQELRDHAARFKLVPSWVISDEPERPVKKEKRNANGNVRSPAPARKAGGGRATRGGGRGDGPYWDSGFPRRGR